MDNEVSIRKNKKLFISGGVYVGRRRKIFKEDILKASFAIIREEGVEQFTARRVAKELHASTQPIYKEFNGMDEVKENLMKCMKRFLEEEVFRIKEERSVVEVCVNYIRFAEEETVLFRSLFMDKELDVIQLHDYSYEALVKAFEQDTTYSGYTNERIRETLDLIWPTVHGIAILVAQGRLQRTEAMVENIAHLLKASQTVKE